MSGTDGLNDGAGYIVDMSLGEVGAPPHPTVLIRSRSRTARTLTSDVRRAFHACFSLEDQKEGMTAFVEKRPPRFENR